MSALRVAGFSLLFLLGFGASAAPRSPEEAAAALRSPERILLRGAEFDVVRGPPAAPVDLLLSPVETASVRYWMVHLRAPASDRIREHLEARGAEIVAYVPNRTYLARLTSDRARELEAEEAVDWVGPYRPDYKLSPEIGTHDFRDPRRPVRPGELLLTLNVFVGESLDRMADEARSRGAEVLFVNRSSAAPRIRVRVREGRERDLARIEGLEWIEEVGEATLRNDVTRWVAQLNLEGVAIVHDHGFFGQGEIIGHIDGPLAHLSCYFEDPTNPIGPAHRKIVAYRSESGFGLDLHGTHTAGTAAGDAEPISGSILHRGMAPQARLAHANFFDLEGYLDTPSNLYEFLEAAHRDGARIHTNSWGDDNFTSYTTWCRDVDRFSRDFEEDLVLFAVTNLSTVRSPENAKNVVAVGATRQAPSQHLLGSGGSGPTADGRRKPELFLPGVGIVSSSTASCGVALQSGTSMASPAVAGCAALVREYYRTGFGQHGTGQASLIVRPTAALVKATLLNGAVDMTGVFGYPSYQEGWGRLLLDEALFFPGDERRIRVHDVRHADGLSTGEVHSYPLEVSPLLSWKITMVFTDQPAALGAAFTPVNDLDLEIEGPGGIYRGNVFAGGISVPGGVPDNLNNVERIVLPAFVFAEGLWTIRVLGTSVPQGPQGYALHVSGALMPASGGRGTGVDPAGAATVAAPYLTQNQPNPFAQSTTLRFGLPHAAAVTLTIHDISGRAVRTLVQESLAEGEYAWTWDGRDTAGSRVAAGIYFGRLRGKGIEESTKMVLLR